jgi:hypothetical protein
MLKLAFFLIFIFSNSLGFAAFQPVLSNAQLCLNLLGDQTSFKNLLGLGQNTRFSWRAATTAKMPFERFPLVEVPITIGKDFFGGFDPGGKEVYLGEMPLLSLYQGGKGVKHQEYHLHKGILQALAANDSDVFYLATSVGILGLINYQKKSWQLANVDPFEAHLRYDSLDKVRAMAARRLENGDTVLGLITTAEIIGIHIPGSTDLDNTVVIGRHPFAVSTLQPVLTLIPSHRKVGDEIIEETLLVAGRGNNSLVFAELSAEKMTFSSDYHIFSPNQNYTGVAGREYFDPRTGSREHAIVVSAQKSIAAIKYEGGKATLVGTPVDTPVELQGLAYLKNSILTGDPMGDPKLNIFGLGLSLYYPLTLNPGSATPLSLDVGTGFPEKYGGVP